MEAVLELIMQFLLSAEGMSATIAIVVALLYRFPALRKVLVVIRLASVPMRKIGAIFIKAADVVEKLIPQSQDPSA
jgi:hypothetical protein